MNRPIADGCLIDVSTTAEEAGFRVPVALTVAAWYEAVAWDTGGMHSEEGRLWDVARSTGRSCGCRVISLKALPSKRSTPWQCGHLTGYHGPSCPPTKIRDDGVPPEWSIQNSPAVNRFQPLPRHGGGCCKQYPSIERELQELYFAVWLSSLKPPRLTN